jgi:hypothetical protein
MGFGRLTSFNVSSPGLVSGEDPERTIEAASKIFPQSDVWPLLEGSEFLEQIRQAGCQVRPTFTEPRFMEIVRFVAGAAAGGFVGYHAFFWIERPLCSAVNRYIGFERLTIITVNGEPWLRTINQT